MVVCRAGSFWGRCHSWNWQVCDRGGEWAPKKERFALGHPFYRLGN